MKKWLRAACALLAALALIFPAGQRAGSEAAPEENASVILFAGENGGSSLTEREMILKAGSATDDGLLVQVVLSDSPEFEGQMALDVDGRIGPNSKRTLENALRAYGCEPNQEEAVIFCCLFEYLKQQEKIPPMAKTMESVAREDLARALAEGFDDVELTPMLENIRAGLEIWTVDGGEWWALFCRLTVKGRDLRYVFLRPLTSDESERLAVAAAPTAVPTPEETTAPAPEQAPALVPEATDALTEAEPTAEAEPEAEATPVVAAIPVEEPAPEVTDKPEEEPTPEVTEEPKAEATVEPEPEPIPEMTEEPKEESTPEATEEPESEPIPEVTEEPEEESTAEATEEPKEEPTPEVTEEPEPEPTPEPEPMKVTRIDVAIDGQPAGDGSFVVSKGKAAQLNWTADGDVKGYTVTRLVDGEEISSQEQEAEYLLVSSAEMEPGKVYTVRITADPASDAEGQSLEASASFTLETVDPSGLVITVGDKIGPKEDEEIPVSRKERFVVSWECEGDVKLYSAKLSLGDEVIEPVERGETSCAYDTRAWVPGEIYALRVVAKPYGDGDLETAKAQMKLAVDPVTEFSLALQGEGVTASGEEGGIWKVRGDARPEIEIRLKGEESAGRFEIASGGDAVEEKDGKYFLRAEALTPGEETIIDISAEPFGETELARDESGRIHAKARVLVPVEYEENAAYETYGAVNEPQGLTVRFTDKAGTVREFVSYALLSGDKEAKEFAVEGGTYVIDVAQGAVAFTPSEGFAGDPDPATVAGTDAYGQKVTCTYQPHVVDNAETRELARTIYYTYQSEEGREAASAVRQAAVFQRTWEIDPQTGEKTRAGGWSLTGGAEYGEVKSPAIEGWHASLETVPGLLEGEKVPEGELPEAPQDVRVVYTPDAPEGADAATEGRMHEKQSAALTFKVRTLTTGEGGINAMERYCLVDVDGQETDSVTVKDEEGAETGRFQIADSRTASVSFEPIGDAVGQIGPVTVRGYDKNGMCADALYTAVVTPQPVKGISILAEGQAVTPGVPVAVEQEKSVTVTWTADGDVKGYAVRVFEDGVLVREETLPGDAGTYTLSSADMKLGKRYDVQVEADPWSAAEGQSRVAVTSLTLKEIPVTGLAVTVNGAGSEGGVVEVEQGQDVCLAWLAQGDVGEYHIALKAGDEVLIEDETYAPDAQQYMYLAGADLRLGDIYTLTVKAVPFGKGLAEAKAQSASFRVKTYAPSGLVASVEGASLDQAGQVWLADQDAEQLALTWTAEGDVAEYEVSLDLPEGAAGSREDGRYVISASGRKLKEIFEVGREYTARITARSYGDGGDQTAEVRFALEPRTVTRFDMWIEGQGVEQREDGVWLVPRMSQPVLRWAIEGDAQVELMAPAGGLSVTRDTSGEGKAYIIDTATMRAGEMYALEMTASLYAHGGVGSDIQESGGTLKRRVQIRLEGAHMPLMKNIPTAVLAVLALLLTAGFVVLLVLLVKRPKAKPQTDLFAAESIKSIRSTEEGPDHPGERTIRRR